jgi:hypothetical protein
MAAQRGTKQWMGIYCTSNVLYTMIATLSSVLLGIHRGYCIICARELHTDCTVAVKSARAGWNVEMVEDRDTKRRVTLL